MMRLNSQIRMVKTRIASLSGSICCNFPSLINILLFIPFPSNLITYKEIFRAKEVLVFL